MMMKLSGRRIGVAALVVGVAMGSMAGRVAYASGLGQGAEWLLVGGSHAAQGYLGVDIQDISDERIGALKLKESRGAEIIHVDHDAPAGKAGLREHDVILQMNGQVIEGEDQLRRMLRETPAGRSVTLLISRDGVQQTVATQMGNREEVERDAWKQRWIVPEPATTEGSGAVAGQTASGQALVGQAAGGQGAAAQGSTIQGTVRSGAFFGPSAPVAEGRAHGFMSALTPGSSYTGAMVETMGTQLAEFFGTGGVGVLVHSVEANSPAASAGLRAGDVVVRANGVKMMSQSDWSKMVRENKGKSMAVVVLREKKEQTLTLVPDGKKRSSVEQPGSGESPVQVAMKGGFSLR